MYYVLLAFVRSANYKVAIYVRGKFLKYDYDNIDDKQVNKLKKKKNDKENVSLKNRKTKDLEQKQKQIFAALKLSKFKCLTHCPNSSVI